ncbi:hypothetical protein LSAT2_007842, partial [Lamellibrachia satsuma]
MSIVRSAVTMPIAKKYATADYDQLSQCPSPKNMPLRTTISCHSARRQKICHCGLRILPTI